MVTKLTLEYDGTNFAGWARQPGRRTVQDELERALATVLRHPVRVKVAGRTDAGVHAWGQVASYSDVAVAPSSLNGLLPADVAVLSSQPALETFDARRDATSRTYCYRILARRQRSVFEAGRALWVPYQLDRAALNACAAALVGRHDFTAFTPTVTGHVRFERHVLQADWRQAGDRLEFWIEADSFMRQMNRVLVGTMLEVAQGSRTVEDFAGLLTGRPRGDAGRTAPARGLYLAGVVYGDRPGQIAL